MGRQVLAAHQLLTLQEPTRMPCRAAVIETDVDVTHSFKLMFNPAVGNAHTHSERELQSVCVWHVLLLMEFGIGWWLA
jgi:hypothetical protein